MNTFPVMAPLDEIVRVCDGERDWSIGDGMLVRAQVPATLCSHYVFGNLFELDGPYDFRTQPTLRFQLNLGDFSDRMTHPVQACVDDNAE